MAGLGSFIQGAMTGYQFAGNMEDRKDARKRRKENNDWQDAARQRQQTAWDRQDTAYNRAEQERSVLAAIGQEAQDGFNGDQQDTAPATAPAPAQPSTGQAAPTTAISTRSAPQEGPSVEAGAPPTNGVPVAQPRGIPQDAYGDRMPQDAQYNYPSNAMSKIPDQVMVEGIVQPIPPAPDTAPVTPSSPSQPVPRGPVPRGIGAASQMDAAPARPDGSPLQQPQDNFTRIAVGLSLPPQAIEYARATDIAVSEAEAGRDMKTGAPLTPDEINQRVEAAGQAEMQLRNLIQQAQPDEQRGPAPVRGGPDQRQAGISDIINDTSYRLQRLRDMLTPNKQRQADLGPVPPRMAADVVTNAAGMASAPVQDAAPGAPRPISQDQAGMARIQPVAPVNISARGRVPSVDTSPAQQPAPPTPRTVIPQEDLGFGNMTSAPGQDAVETAPPGSPEKEAAMRNLHETAITQPPDKGGSPSVAVAAETAPTQGRGVLGADDTVKTTKAARDQASRNFLDYYAKNAVPKIVEYYASQGDIQKAEAFEKWANARETRGQLESWSKAVHAAAIGDEDGFLDNLSDTYNSFDDGYEIVRDQSSFTKDENGNITGGSITLLDTNTGKTFVKEYKDQADIISEAIYTLSPEQIFEKLWGEVAQASEVAAEQRKFERQVMLEQVKAGLRGGEQPISPKEIESAKRAMNDQWQQYGGKMPDGRDWSSLSDAEQTQLAVGRVKASRAAARTANLPPAPAPYAGPSTATAQPTQ